MRRAALWIAYAILEIVGFLVSTVATVALAGAWEWPVAVGVGAFLAVALLLTVWMVRKRYAMRP